VGAADYSGRKSAFESPIAHRSIEGLLSKLTESLHSPAAGFIFALCNTQNPRDGRCTVIARAGLRVVIATYVTLAARANHAPAAWQTEPVDLSGQVGWSLFLDSDPAALFTPPSTRQVPTAPFAIRGAEPRAGNRLRQSTVPLHSRSTTAAIGSSSARPGRTTIRSIRSCSTTASCCSSNW
jgi:hypothetical protein